MNDPSSPDQQFAFWGKAWVTAILLVATAFAIGLCAKLAFSVEDTEPLETPLLMSVARQLYGSPWELYGPFGRNNPWVLIHAPFYYRVTALTAWLLVRAGMDPILAALVAGRSLSMLGLAVTLIAAFRLARIDGAPAIAGWWTVLLIVATPLLGSQPYSVRPDMMGVALQTTGLLLIMVFVRSKRRRSVMLLAAFAAFALAACVKQHFVVVAAISTVWLLVTCGRDQSAYRLIGRGLLLALALVFLVYGTDEVLTQGRMSRAIFVAAANVRRIHPSDWRRVLIVFLAIIGRTSGVILLLVAASLILIWNRRGHERAAVAVVGTCCIGLVVGARACMEVVSTDLLHALWVIAVLTTSTLFIPLCARLERRPAGSDQLGAALWLFMAAELAVVVVLCRASTGAWVNYAIQAAVFACILTGRALERALANVAFRRALVPLVLASLITLANPVVILYSPVSHRYVDHIAKEMIFEQMKTPRQQFFFVDRPGDNRLDGRLDLVYDDWLYPVFESIKMAEPRSTWLLVRLTSGSVRCVVNTSDKPQIPGLSETLPELGFIRRIQVGPFFVWERVQDAPSRYPHIRAP